MQKLHYFWQILNTVSWYCTLEKTGASPPLKHAPHWLQINTISTSATHSNAADVRVTAGWRHSLAGALTSSSAVAWRHTVEHWASTVWRRSLLTSRVTWPLFLDTRYMPDKHTAHMIGLFDFHKSFGFDFDFDLSQISLHKA